VPLLRRLVATGAVFGLNAYQFVATIRNAPKFYRHLRQYRRLQQRDFPFTAANLEPILTDFRAPAGIARGHYFHQDLWAARKIAARAPNHHLDVGSRVDGFVAHLLTIMPVTVIDIRPLESDVDGLTFLRADATRLDTIASASVESLSSLHAVEHIGLGRYGDTVDPNGWAKAVSELSRILALGGRLYLSVPVGRQRLCFNAHRVFRPRTIIDACAPLRLVSFSAVDDADRLITDASPDAFDNAQLACGLFEFTKELT
jgi:SAM-dependent methyltransferase